MSRFRSLTKRSRHRSKPPDSLAFHVRQTSRQSDVLFFRRNFVDAYAKKYAIKRPLDGNV